MGNENKIFEVKDINGKSFSIDLNKIHDINGDIGNSSAASISDNQKNRVRKVHDIEYCDQEGQAIDSLQLLSDMASGKKNIVALDVEMEATHSGRNHNYCIYYEDSMETDAESFVNPFKKPVLKNHDTYSEPMGRILQAWTGPSALTEDRSVINLKARITDQESIPKFLDGRYGTVSIGGTMGTVTCNICGKNILKDGKFKFCGHWKGETYKDEICYWGAKDIEYHEVSTVNNPADDYAQIMKVTVVTDNNKDNQDKKEESNMSDELKKENTTDTKAADVKTAISDMIDKLLGEKTADADTKTPEAEVTDNKDPEADPIVEDSTATTEDATQEIETLKTQLADATAKLGEVEAELATTKDSLEKQTKDLQDSQAEATDAKDKCIALATLNKELIADSIIHTEVTAGTIKEDAKDSRKEELLGMSMKDLNALVAKSVDSAPPQRQPAHVDNPTLSIDDKKDSNGSADTHKTTDAVKTINNFADDIIKKLVK